MKIQAVPPILKSLAINYFFLAFAAFRRPLLRKLMSKPISFLLWKSYVPSSHASVLRRFVGDTISAAVLLLPALLGSAIRGVAWLRRKEPNPMLKSVIK